MEAAMSDLTPPDQDDGAEDDAELEKQLKSLIPAVRTALNAKKTIRRLISAGTDLGVALAEAGTSRLQLAKARNEAQIATLRQSVPGIAGRAAARLIEDQQRVEDVVIDGLQRVIDGEATTRADPQKESAAGPTDSIGPGEIEDDWLLSFRREVEDRGVGEMRETFCRILAGEIKRPGTFSIRTLRIVGALDQRTAALFRQAVSVSIRLQDTRPGGAIYDARIPALSGQLSKNALSGDGLGYDQLTHMTEMGLLHGDYNSEFPYRLAIPKIVGKRGVPTIQAPMIHQGTEWVLLSAPNTSSEKSEAHRTVGAAFTSAGRELMVIVDIAPNPDFTRRLKTYFEGKKLSMVRFIPH